MSSDEHAVCIADSRRWQRIASIAVAVTSVILFAMIALKIRSDIRKAIINKSTATVAAEAISVSNTAVLLLDERGTVVKSNDEADMIFAKGEDIRGRTIHDYCVDKLNAEHASDKMQTWYQSAPVGARRLLIVTAQLPTGPTDIMIMATALRREPGSNIAVMAIVSYWNQVAVTDIRKSQPAQVKSHE